MTRHDKIYIYIRVNRHPDKKIIYPYMHYPKESNCMSTIFPPLCYKDTHSFLTQKFLLFVQSVISKT